MGAMDVDKYAPALRDGVLMDDARVDGAQNGAEPDGAEDYGAQNGAQPDGAEDDGAQPDGAEDYGAQNGAEDDGGPSYIINSLLDFKMYIINQQVDNVDEIDECINDDDDLTEMVRRYKELVGSVPEHVIVKFSEFFRYNRKVVWRSPAHKSLLKKVVDECREANVHLAFVTLHVERRGTGDTSLPFIWRLTRVPQTLKDYQKDYTTGRLTATNRRRTRDAEEAEEILDNKEYRESAEELAKQLKIVQLKKKRNETDAELKVLEAAKRPRR
eukprot:TRINITY_DN227_c0_g1_i1.p1 TRINITY_DN227_c0_g1~~TRINITY_DN227_c0_g1_i1.p1  ORF type:complete len:271 (+),score=-9.61 TRINITY_DN227_c0_g1_i1:70-882(+)